MPQPAALLVFVRAPRAGEVKTRLAAAIGADAALRVYRRLAEQALRAARGVGQAAQVRVHYTPAGARQEVEDWLGPGPAYFPQEEGDLGARMAAAFAQAFAAGYTRVVIVGSDLPGLSTTLLADALHLLEAHAAVLGPALDGGYWLLGLRAPAPALFRDMAWSGDGVLAATLERMAALSLDVALLPALSDVDVEADLPPGWDD